MDAFPSGVVQHVLQVEKQGLCKVVPCLVHTSKLESQMGMDAEAQAAVVDGQGLVFLPDCLFFSF